MTRIFSFISTIAIALTAVAQSTDSVAPVRVRHGNQGIVAIGDSTSIRAMGTFKGGSECLADYAAVANLYYDNWEGKVNIYCMPIPTAVAVYGDMLDKTVTRDQWAPIKSCFKALDKEVKSVDILPVLRQHADEAIYSRTDHHWAPLGAYYAAREFARVAGVPFKDLSAYDERVVHGFVGTMPKWSGISEVRRYPEDLVYHVPTGVDYTTTYIDYTLDKSRRNVVKASEPHEGNFFWSYKDGSGLAYCTFMGGDCKLTQVKTSTGNGRRLLILKDSYGNAIPGYLFYSFEEIHVVDCRYFTLNLTQYVTDHGVTDILLANNMGHAASARTTKFYRNYLKQ